MLPPEPESPPDRPAHHVVHPITGTVSYRNPWPSASAPTASELLFGGAWLGWPKLHLNKHPKARELRVLDPGDWGRAKVHEMRQMAEQEGRGNKVGFARSTWLGHAAVYVQLPLDSPPDPLSGLRRRSIEGEPDETKIRVGGAGAVDEEDQYGENEGPTLKLLFDPIFSERAGPTSYTGPGRLRTSPCEVQDLPGVDAVLISHNHYDHLDANSIKQVLDKWPRAKYFVPLGNKQWFFASGVPLSQIIELDWWDDVELTPSDFGLVPPPLANPTPLDFRKLDEETSSGQTSRSRSLRSEQPREKERVRFTCVPAQHNSGRSPADQGSTLWCGWVVEHLVESDPPKRAPSFSRGETNDSAITTTSTASFVSAPEADELTAAMAQSVLVEEPDEGDFAIDEDDDDADKGSSSRDSRALLEPSSARSSPLSTPGGSTNDLSLQPISSGEVASSEAVGPLQVPKSRRGSRSADPSPQRRGSVSQLLQRSSSFSKSLTRRLSNAERPSLPSRRSSLSTPVAPSPLSRSSSLRIAREHQQAREASSEPGIQDNSPDGHASGVSSPGEPAALGKVADAETLETEEVDVEKLVAEERARENAAKAKRAEAEIGRAVQDGRWSKRVVRKGAIFHAGDTGYRRHRRCQQPVCPAFDEIGLKFGPFDMSFVPIWRGGSLGFVSAIGLRLHHENISSALHGSPADAVDIHLDVRSRNTIGVHFGTFIGSESESLEAIIELQEAVEEAGVKTLDDPNEDEMGRMGVIDIGETWCSEIHNLLIVS